MPLISHAYDQNSTAAVNVDVNRDAFKAAPAKYAPRFGGFCAMGVALEKQLDGDPTAWTVADGKL